MLHGTFLLDPEAGLAFEAVMALLSAPRPVTTTVTADGEIVEIRDPRDKGQRQADALATLCHDFLARHADRARPASGDLRAGEMQAGEMRAGEMRAGEMRAGEAGVGEEGAGKADAGEAGAGEAGAGEAGAGEAGAGEAGAGEAGAGEAPAGQTRDAQAPAPRTQPRDEPPESAAAARAADVAPAMPPPVSRPEDRTVSGSAGVGSADVGSAGDPPTSAEAAGPRSGGVYFGRAPTVILITATAEQVAGAPAVGLATGSLSGHPVSRGTLRRLSCDAALQRVLLSPGGAVLDLGRTVRLASAAQRRAITARDGHCLVAGCRTPVALCDLHHVRHWADGGRTDLENLAPLCPRHHTAVHAGEWQVVLRDGLPWVVPPPWLDPQRRPVRNPLADAVQDVLRTGQAINHAHADRHAPPRLTCDDPDMRSSRSAA
jgi:hypothetical protein